MHYETIKYGCISKSDFKLKIQTLLEKYWPSFRFDVKRINKLLDSIVDSAYIYFEMPYVDRVFRDTYYTFFASKYKQIPRNCIRVFIFKSNITEEDLVNTKNKLQDKYLGYFIIRPVEQRTLGRSFLSPQAFINKDILSMLAKEKSLLRGNMLSCNGFPHIAQDSEIMTCAESSIWMLLEYYSNRYKNYSPAMPSQITEVLQKESYKRLLPSEGLTIFQISLAVKSF